MVHERYILPNISRQILSKYLTYNNLYKRNLTLYKSNYSKIHELITVDQDSVLDEIIKQYLVKGNYCSVTTRLQLCKEKLISHPEKEFRIYVDRSVRNTKTEHIESIFGLTIYDENNSLVDTYFSIIEI